LKNEFIYPIWVVHGMTLCGTAGHGPCDRQFLTSDFASLTWAQYWRVLFSNMSSFDPSAPPLIKETLLKSRRTLEELKHRRATTVGRQVSRKRVLRGEDVKIKRPEQFLRENNIKAGSFNRMNRRKRQATARSRPDVDRDEMRPTVGLVVRIHGGRHASDLIKKDLRDMGLARKYDARFIKLDESAISKLKGQYSFSCV
jgi:hypothetical protein